LARMASFWLACCAVREPRGQDAGADEDDALEFFDCAETEAELAAMCSAQTPERQQAPQSSIKRALTRMLSSADGELAAARAVLSSARDEWCQRVVELRRTASTELEWANLPTARRMLKANIGDAKKAVRMFVQAMEMRSQHAQLLREMRCEEAKADIRIMGQDLEGHPVVYMCARNQTAPLGCIRDQLVVTMEAACKLAGDMGTVAFVVDMHGLQPHLNMDFKAMKDLGDLLGTVYAERICRITIVDFSRAAQAIWWAMKPMLKPATKEKFAFVSQAQGKQLCEEHLDPELCSVICRTFEVNRDPSTTDEVRARHARDTTFGAPLN